jgi:hypothetical protein
MSAKLVAGDLASVSVAILGIGIGTALITGVLVQESFTGLWAMVDSQFQCLAMPDVR